jgi:hypothetical protein
MMNLELLFWAVDATGERYLYEIAYKHATTTMNRHVRANYSSYHVSVWTVCDHSAVRSPTPFSRSSFACRGASSIRLGSSIGIAEGIKCVM